VTDSSEQSGKLGPSVTLAYLGRRLRGARVIAGYDRMTDFASAIERVCGVSISARTLYAIERGEQMPSLEHTICILSVLPPEEQEALLQSAVRPDVHERLWFAADKP
jgi:DNA-binding XRE family transcriptional regulator